ncbi:hypothetical protein [Bacillus massiliglaciei]|uniref:hypothetical protein n=1 Tax=Bacillus massiliglaciei TaxID=1816693 RepID=UPI000DA60537|nr:hypothetical protein [Bacillus massiliglaciei]
MFDKLTALAIVSLFVLLSVLLLLLVPFFGFYGFVSILGRLWGESLFSVDFFESHVMNFGYILLVLGSVYLLISLLELLFIILKKREILQLSHKFHKLLAFLMLVFCSFLLTKTVILTIFQRFHSSDLFLLFVFFAVYLGLFICSDTYKKQDTIF